MKKYRIVRKFYMTPGHMEAGSPYLVHQHSFTPLTLQEAQTIKPKLCQPVLAGTKIAIDVIEEITK